MNCLLFFFINLINKKMDYSKKKRHELIAICKENKINGYSKKTKDEIIKLIIEPIAPIVKEKRIKNTKRDLKEDSYTKDLLIEQYALHKSYVIGRKKTTKKTGVTVRLPSIPEDISENIIKQIIQNKLGDKSSSWDCKTGDLQSKTEGKQECKCFTSNGPLSFTPSSDWDVLYFLDARKWLEDKFILFQIPLKRTSTEWKNIKVNKKQTFDDQTRQKRRPRITWKSLEPQLGTHCNKLYEGTFDDIFIHLDIDK